MTEKEELQSLKDSVKRLQEKAARLEAKIAADDADKMEKFKQFHLDTCLDALIVGARGLKARYGATHPYTTGYYAASQELIKREFCQSVYSFDSFEALGGALYEYLKEKQWKHEDFLKLKRKSDALWDSLPTGYHRGINVFPRPSFEPDGYETDKFDFIVKNDRGDARSYLAAKLIALKGYCVEGFLTRHPEDKPVLEKVFKRHGLDCDLSDLDKWAERNPTRCMSTNKYYKEV